MQTLPIRATFKGCSVDAGNMSVYDAGLCPLDRPPLATHFIDVGAPGTYKVSLLIPNTYKGTVKKTGRVTTLTGRFYVGDLCYGLSRRDDWEQVIKSTHSLTQSMPGVLLANLGGDGGFDVTVTILEKVPEN